MYSAQWTTQCVIQILKPDKPSKHAGSYRPISLSSCLGKIFEYMTKSRLDWYMKFQFNEYENRTPGPLTTREDFLSGKSPTLSNIWLEAENSFTGIRKQCTWPCYITPSPITVFHIQLNYKIPLIIIYIAYRYVAVFSRK